MNKKFRLINKKRFYSFVIIVIIAVSSLVFATNIKGESADVQYHKITVEKGDTLWGIAKRYNTDGDIRSYINIIKKVNNISGSTIYEGDVILLPA
jgi:LysM repeat protein